MSAIPKELLDQLGWYDCFYIITANGVEERLDIEQPDVQLTSDGLPVHTAAIKYANSLRPPPEQVEFAVVTEVHDGMLHMDRRVVFQYHAELETNDGSPPELLELDEALDNFMNLAFPHGQDEVTWSGPVGLNKAIANLKASYFHKFETRNLH